jgi:cysteinyl-tRNA synthetase
MKSDNFLQTGVDTVAIADLINQRTAANAAKNFALAVNIRKDLLDMGIVLKDSVAGTTWEVVS